MTLQALFYVEQNYCYAILRPLQREILRRGGQVRWFLVGNQVDEAYLREDELRLKDVPAVKAWQPDVVFVPGNYVSSCIPGLKVQVFHGFDSGKVNRKGRRYHFEIRHCFDLYCTHGASTTGQFEELQKQYQTFLVEETGWPAVDPLFEYNAESSSRSSGQKTVLFCSTHSPRFSCAKMIFPEIRRMIEQSAWRWLIQFHPMMAQETVDMYRGLKGENVEFIETDNVIPLLKTADVMLSDTSAILLQFLLQYKPVVTFNNQMPGKHLIDVSDVNEVQTALQFAMTYPENLIKNIKHYCEQMHPWRDGMSSGRVIDSVNKILETGAHKKIKRKPINFLREYKMRKQLGCLWG